MDIEDDPFARLGKRLKEVRLSSKKSLREMAQEFEVSATFLSQIENGKSRPSVATLYTLARALDVDMDSLLCPPEPAELDRYLHDTRSLGVKEQLEHMANRSHSSKARIVTTDATHRNILTLDSGVTWERLATLPESGGHFVEIVYRPGAETSPNGALISHEGFEYGYALSGDLEMTIGDFVFSLSQGHSFGFDSSIPHIFKNKGEVDFRGVWFVHSCHGRR